MDRFNRFVVVVILLLAMPLCTITLAIPGEIARLLEGLGGILAAWIGGPGSTLTAAAQSVTVLGRVLLALAAIGINLALGLLLFYELRRPTGGFTVRARGSIAQVSPESIQAQVMHRVSAVDGVLDLDVRVRPMPGGRVELTLDVLVAPDVMVARKVNEITKAVKQVVNRHMGLRLFGGPIIHLELASPSALAHADEMIRHPVPIEAPGASVGELGGPAPRALPAAPHSNNTPDATPMPDEAAADAGREPEESGDDLPADGE